jgi:hypothetical protein
MADPKPKTEDPNAERERVHRSAASGHNAETVAPTDAPPSPGSKGQRALDAAQDPRRYSSTRPAQSLHGIELENGEVIIVNSPYGSEPRTVDAKTGRDISAVALNRAAEEKEAEAKAGAKGAKKAA